MVPFYELVRRGEKMKLLKNLLVVIAATGVMGSAQGQTLPPIDLGILSPAVSVATGTFTSASFLDTVTFQLATTDTVTGTTSGTNVSNLSFQLFADGGITPLSTALDLHQDLGPGSYHALISGDLVTGAAGGQFTFSVAAHNPEPAEWMLMLCGLVVAGFIARRKIDLVAG